MPLSWWGLWWERRSPRPPFDIELDEAGQPVNYKQVFTGTCTAYTCDGGRLSGVTATGYEAPGGRGGRQSQGRSLTAPSCISRRRTAPMFTATPSREIPAAA